MADIELGDLDWLNDQLERMQRLSPEGEYFALRLTADHRNVPTRSCDSWWVGDSDKGGEQGHWELRRASPTDPALRAQAWATMGQSWVTADDEEQLAIFLRMGGNALIEAGLAEKRLPSVIGRQECVRDGLDESGTLDARGYIAFREMPEDAAVARTPRRKVRMSVLARDDFRCVVCGRRPRDHIDLELHVHHLIPWRLSGPTALDNLVTLCGTCHKGLRSDFEPKLRELAGLPGPIDTWDFNNVELDDSVARYRDLLTFICDDPETLIPVWLFADHIAAQHTSHDAASGRDRFTRLAASSNRLTIPWTVRELTDALYLP